MTTDLNQRAYDITVSIADAGINGWQKKFPDLAFELEKIKTEDPAELRERLKNYQAALSCVFNPLVNEEFDAKTVNRTRTLLAELEALNHTRPPLYLSGDKVDEVLSFTDHKTRVYIEGLLAERDKELAAHENTIEAAVGNYTWATDDVEIDANPPLAIVEEDGKTVGVWVNAWVWVPIEQD